MRTLRTHELQDSNMKAAIEFARDLLCIDEIDFDRWFKGKSFNFSSTFFTSKFRREFTMNLRKARIEEPIDPATYYKVNLKGEIAEEKNDLDCVTSYKLFRLGF